MRHCCATQEVGQGGGEEGEGGSPELLPAGAWGRPGQRHRAEESQADRRGPVDRGGLCMGGEGGPK